MIVKTIVCKNCLKAQPLSGFYKNNKSRCMACVKEANSKRRKTERGKILRAQRRAKPENRQKKRARDKVRNLWRRGVIPRPEKCICTICGGSKPATHYHHHKGYEGDAATDVIPLCWDHYDMDKGGPRRLPDERQLPLFNGDVA